MTDTIDRETGEVWDRVPAQRNRSQEIDKIAAALAKAQSAMGAVERAGVNPAFKRDGKASTYATLASVLEVIRKPLSDNGIALVQWPRTAEGGVEIETLLVHESGQYMRDVLWLPCPQLSVHAVGSCITYGRRFAAMSIVGVAPSDEDDGNAAAAMRKAAAADEPVAIISKKAPRQSSDHGRQLAADEPHLIENERQKGEMPGNGTTKNDATAKRIAWVNASIEGFNTLTAKPQLTDWWKSEQARRDVIEQALPDEYERLVTAYDFHVDRLS